MKKLLIFLIVFDFALTPVWAQEKKVIRSSEIPTTCEVSQRILDTIHELAQGGKIMIIARLGNGETSNAIARTRLQKVKKYLEIAWKRPSQNIIVAIGEKATGLGRLELYANGILVDEIFARKKKNIPTFCKGPD